MRWLLAVMLYHADDCGVLRDNGMADLNNLTGMTEKRIRSHLLSFQKLGYVKRVVPGVVDPGWLGRRKSIYYLNLDHKVFGDHKRHSIYLHIKGCELAFRDRSFARSILYAKKSRELYVQIPETYLIVRRDDIDLSKRGAYYLQIKLCEYVSKLLRENWERLPERPSVVSIRPEDKNFGEVLMSVLSELEADLHVAGEDEFISKKKIIQSELRDVSKRSDGEETLSLLLRPLLVMAGEVVRLSMVTKAALLCFYNERCVDSFDAVISLHPAFGYKLFRESLSMGAGMTRKNDVAEGDVVVEILIKDKVNLHQFHGDFQAQIERVGDSGCKVISAKITNDSQGNIFNI
ncbi:hypothetical protein A8C75_08890 [Marinobacterium aestuarii]|uniref:Uncharacterized protein n=2 Tax=Marinobacterium aestuarii TaxID=1821621 RepID=A0A1A9EXJ5_9GAMM|nr:hypothetical protein A8C75_08890 [Marinobacterium aestuarii]